MADKDPVASWTLRLRDELSGEAANAAKALDALRASIKGEQDELAELQRNMRELKAKGGDDLKANMRALKEQIDAKRASIGKARESYKQLAERTGDLKTRGAQLKTIFGALEKAVAKLPGPLGGFASGLVKSASKMASSRLVTLGLTAGFVALAGAAALGAKRLLDSAVAAQDARRNELLHLEALTKVRNFWGLAAGKASEMQAAIDNVSASVSIGRDKVAGYATQLYQSGLRGEALSQALEGASIKASALGDAAGSGFAGWASAVALTGGSVKRLSEDVKNRFGGIVQKQMQGLEVSALKAREGFASLFTGLNIEPFLEALSRLRSLFAQNTASGRALKQLMTLLLEPLLGAATDGTVAMRRFFKQMVIGVQEITIAFLTVRNWFRKTFGSSETRPVLARLFGSFQLGRVVVYALAVAFSVMAVNVLAAVAPLLLVGAAIYFAIETVQGLYDLWNEIDWKGLGVGIWEGIVGGVKAGLNAVKSAFSDLASEATTAFKRALGIASPSRVFATLGLSIPQGIEQGIEKGSPDAQAAAANVVQAPKLGNTAAAPADRARAGTAATAGASSVTVSIASINVAAKTDDPRSYAEALRRELESVLESMAVQLGAAGAH